jgi:signal transduction histidine kinase
MTTSSASFAKSRNAVPLSVAALTIAGVGLFVVQQMRPIDRDIFERLVVAFGEPELPSLTPQQLAVNWLTIGGALNGIGFAIIGVSAAYVVLKLSGIPRVICTVSLFVLSLMYQWLLWHFLHLEPHPVGFFTALLSGVGTGIILRAREDRRRQVEAHYYELKLKNKELLETRLELLKQDEMERRILAADLHDQVLNDLKQVAQRFDRYSSEPDPENAERIKTLTNQVMSEIREVMDSLSPSVLEHLGLGAAIEDCLRRGSERANFRTRFKSRVDSDVLECLSMVEQGLLYRLVQESITNICKHAGASTVRAALEMEEDYLLIKIIDDGKGIDPAKARGDSRGLKYMRYRADLIGATIGWKPGENGKGTTVEIRVNIADRVNAQAAQLQAQAAQEQVATRDS